MKEEFVEFARYCGASLGCKAIAYYLVPSLILRLTFYDEVSFTYLFYAISLLAAGNFFVQLFLCPRYKGQVKFFALHTYRPSSSPSARSSVSPSV